LAQPGVEIGTRNPVKGGARAVERRPLQHDLLARRVGDHIPGQTETVMTRSLRGRLIVWGASVGLSGMLVPPALADAVEDFYRGKTVTIVVGFSTGNGADSYARLLSRFMGKHIPGNPSIIVQNMPGAGSLVAAGRSAGDGLRQERARSAAAEAGGGLGRNGLAIHRTARHPGRPQAGAA
jgi:hypothetical protein